MSKTQLIKSISEQSDYYGNLLILFMDEEGISSLREATREQLEAFIERHGLKGGTDNE